MGYTSDRTWYRDSNGTLYEAAGDGRELLVRKGGELSDADAARFGLVQPPKRKQQTATTDAAAVPQSKEG